MEKQAGGFGESGQKPLQKKEYSEKPHYAGHRERLRSKFIERGDSALMDYELLEMLLFRVYPRMDTKPLAKNLIAEFGSFGQVLAAPASRLKEVKGIGDAAAAELNLIFVAGQRLASRNIQKKTLLSSWKELIEYCHSAMAFHEVEQFRILFLDKKNHLIKDEVQQIGSLDHTPVYPREVAKRSLELSAAAIILAHNHPSGDPTPSRADVEMTQRIVDIVEPLGIVVHDHIIIGKDGHASLKALQLF